jgi:hypothetical protein
MQIFHATGYIVFVLPHQLFNRLKATADTVEAQPLTDLLQIKPRGKWKCMYKGLLESGSLLLLYIYSIMWMR